MQPLFEKIVYKADKHTIKRGTIKGDNGKLKKITPSPPLDSLKQEELNITLQDFIKKHNKERVGIVLGDCIPRLICIDIDTKDIREKFEALTPKQLNTLLTVQDDLGEGLHLYYLEQDYPLHRYLYGDSKPTKILKNLDFILGNNFIWLPTAMNETKFLTSKQTPKIAKHKGVMPYLVQSLVQSTIDTDLTRKKLLTKSISTKPINTLDNNTASSAIAHLQSSYMTEDGRILESNNDKFLTQLVNWRGGLPDRIDDLSKHTATPHGLLCAISVALKNDVGISPENHTQILHQLNKRLGHPKNEQDLNNQIILPDTGGEDYPYNKNWKNLTVTMITAKYNHILELYYIRSNIYTDNKYLIHNVTLGETDFKKTKLDLQLDLLARVQMAKNAINQAIDRVTPIKLASSPLLDFGIHKNSHDDDKYNFYRRNIYQEIFYQKDKSIYGHLKGTPKHILTLLHSGWQENLNRYLGFLKRKLQTQDRSALTFALWGVPFSFKSAQFGGIITPLFGNQQCHTMGIETLTEKYNNHLVGTDCIFVDEVHQYIQQDIARLRTFNNSLDRETMGSIRGFGTGTITSDEPMHINLWLASNSPVKNLISEIGGDRRLVVSKATRTASDVLGVPDSKVKKLVQGELEQFAYYLAHEVEDISDQDYLKNDSWKNDSYFEYIGNDIDQTKQLLIAIGIGMPNLTDIQNLIVDSGFTLSKFITRRDRTLTKGGLLFEYNLRLYSNKPVQGYPALLEVLQDVEVSKLKRELQLNDRYHYGNQSSGNYAKKMDFYLTQDDLDKHHIVIYDDKGLNIKE